MNEYSTGLTFITLAALGIGAMYAQPLARRIRDSVLIARDRERLNYLAPIASENFDELLVAIPGASTAKLSNTAEVPAQYLLPKLLSPFGDW